MTTQQQNNLTYSVGKGFISAEVIKDSISEAGVRILTYEFVFPRWILAEFLTHRVFSRNSASSRAIPINKMIDHIRKTTAVPVYWGKNQPGMSAKEEISDEDKVEALKIWMAHAESCIATAEKLDELGVHKQICNRTIEGLSLHKVIVTSTEWDNWDELRDHPDAQPEIQELAKVAKIARSKSNPQLLKSGEWHLPYVDLIGGKYYTVDSLKQEVPLENAIKISASCCAQVSYRNNDTSLEKALKIFDRLIEAEPKHLSPVEHQATPADLGTDWSGNFRGWIQYRKLIELNALFE